MTSGCLPTTIGFVAENKLALKFLCMGQDLLTDTSRIDNDSTDHLPFIFKPTSTNQPGMN